MASANTIVNGSTTASNNSKSTTAKPGSSSVNTTVTPNRNQFASSTATNLTTKSMQNGSSTTAATSSRAASNSTSMPNTSARPSNITAHSSAAVLASNSTNSHTSATANTGNLSSFQPVAAQVAADTGSSNSNNDPLQIIANLKTDEQALEQHFKTADTNHNGGVNSTEFINYVQSLLTAQGVQMTDSVKSKLELVKIFMKKFDLDGNEEISLTELKKMIATTFPNHSFISDKAAVGM
uniref:EF-hand domain-containing protein n=1 Tax=Plectus sambesii TaxID=2011161 RepID=A0A914W086_9BILA